MIRRWFSPVKDLGMQLLVLYLLIIIPALILTFMVQKHLVSGLTFGGVKG